MKLPGALLTFFLCSVSYATTYHVKPEDTKVSWLGKTFPQQLNIEGDKGRFEGTLEEKDGKLSGVLKLEAAKLETGIALRDEHMRDKYLEVKKHPYIEMAIKDVPVADGKGPFTGMLTVKGETKPVTGKMHMATVGLEKVVKVEFPVKVSDYPSIGAPNFKGMVLADVIEITAEGSAMPLPSK